MSKLTAGTIIGVAALGAVVALITTDHGDIADIGVVMTLAAQLLNLVFTSHVELKVNGNLSKLIEAKTQRDTPTEVSAAPSVATPPETPAAGSTS